MINEKLEQRKEIYGDYKGNLNCRLEILSCITNRYRRVHGNNMSCTQEMLFQDIIAKLARLAVTPNHLDSWEDIAGYATRICQVIKNENN